MKVIRIGLDTSKHVFQIHAIDEDEQAGSRRIAIAKFVTTLAPTRIRIEACGASRHWAGVLHGLGH
jgi:transposase